MQIIVVGMHRSGTSVLARLLNMMGVYFGSEGSATNANVENPKGFWERTDVRNANDYLLQYNDFDWNYIHEYRGEEDFSPETVSAFEKAIKRIILGLDAFRPWFLKEPRFCLTLPIWRKHLEVPLVLYIYRNPLEVAKSLNERNGFPIPYGLALWERYNDLAIRGLGDTPSMLVSHAELMKRPLHCMEKVYDFLNSQQVEGIRKLKEREVLGFVSPSLYRSKITTKDEVDLSPSQRDLLKKLEQCLYKNVKINHNTSKAGLEIIKEYELMSLPNKKDEINAINSKLKEVSEKFESQRKMSEERQKALKEELSAYKKQLNQKLIKSEKEHYEREAKILKNLINQQRDEINSKSNEINQLRNRVESLVEYRFKFENLKNSNEHLKNSNENLRSNIQQLKLELKEETDEKNSLKKNLQNLSQESETLNDKLKQYSYEIGNLKIEKEDLLNKTSSLNEQSNKRKSHIKSLEREKRRAREELAALRTHIANLEKQRGEMEAIITEHAGRIQKMRIKNRVLSPFKKLFKLPLLFLKKILHLFKRNEKQLSSFHDKVNAVLNTTNNKKAIKAFKESEGRIEAFRMELGPSNQKPTPQVSIVMPTHNRADIILEAINSIISQSYENWELLVCDDASTDNTGKLIKGLNEDRVKYFKLEKCGAAAARNHGLSQSQGEYIAYLDSDNIWHPNFLELTVNALLSRNGYQCVFSRYIDVVIEDEKYRIKSIKSLEFNYEKLSQKNFIDLNTFVHHRSLYDHFGGFNNELKRQQDWDLVLKYTFLRDPLYIDSFLVFYQRNKKWNQITQVQKTNKDSYYIIQNNIQSYYTNGLVSQKQETKADRPSITILSWDVCRNHFSKAFNVAEALSNSYNVQLLGFRFFEVEIFEPYEGVEPNFELTIIDGDDFPSFHEAMSEALLKIKGDVVYAVKPRLASLGLALLANYNFRKKVILEFNDLETVVANPDIDEVDEKFHISKINLDSQELLSPYSITWSKVMEEFGKKVPITVTHNKNLDSHFGGKSFYIRNLKDEKYYDPDLYDRDKVRRELGFKTTDKVILFGGLLRKHKGIYELIELVDKLGDENYKILFVGSRVTPDQKKLAEEYGTKVTILPPQGRNDMAKINYAADLVILWLDPNKPVSHYQMPYKFTDAIAMKVPVIANEISDLDDLGHMGYLRLVKYGNFRGLIDEIRSVFNDRAKTKEMVEAARNLYLRQFCYRAVKSNIDLILERSNPELLDGAKEFAEFYSNFYQHHKEKTVSV